jgi:hypothetical protein
MEYAINALAFTHKQAPVCNSTVILVQSHNFNAFGLELSAKMPANKAFIPCDQNLSHIISSHIQ